jgi:aminocarboxymuconate-semialdehyde decarboxylase
MPCKRVDLHTHILPKKLPDLSAKYGYGGWISTEDLPNGGKRMMLDGKPFRDIECNCYDPEARIDETDGQIQVLSTIPVLFNYWAKPDHCLDLAKYLNDDISMTCQQYPKKFIGLGTLPMQAPELAVQELYRCVNELGLKGIQIGSHINEWNLDEPALDPIWTACEELDVPVFVHPWDMQQDGRMSKYWFPWLIGMPCETTIAICSLIFGGVLERHPKIRFCFAHAGGAFPYTLGRIEHGFQVRPDIVATNNKVNPLSYIGRFWCDSLIHDEEALDLLIKKIGIDRIILGSDYPFPLGEHEAGKMVAESSRLTEEQKYKILFGNVFEFFGPRLDKSFYE